MQVLHVGQPSRCQSVSCVSKKVSIGVAGDEDGYRMCVLLYTDTIMGSSLCYY